MEDFEMHHPHGEPSDESTGREDEGKDTTDDRLTHEKNDAGQ